MYQYHTLYNGLKVILSQHPSRVTYSGVYINVGSRDERGHDEGMAHFIEHSLFKGTEHRHAHHIQNRIDGVGGELNAFTTKEETCVYASSLSEHLERCLELFADILFHSTFPLKEIEKEKDVVLEEINSYSDSPAELIYDQYEELAYEGHPLAHNILGTRRDVKRFTPERLRHFLHSNYRPSRMVVTVAGDVTMERLLHLCEKYFGQYENTPATVDRSTRPTFHPFERHINRHTHQAHLLIGCEAPDIYHSDKTAFSLLNNILGGPAMNSRLNVAVREHYGFCYNIESQYVPFSDTGLFYIYAGVDLDAQERARRIILDELRRLCDTPLTPAQLRSAQRQLSGQMAINDDYGLNEMQSIGKAYLCYDHVHTLEEMKADLLAVTADDLQRVAQNHFDPERFGTLIYGN
ncbi:MAG: insulinase family protein [Bacteroidales bacterium]|nr:insulinase family protein [Bacteroidales bacterium]